MKPSKKKTSPKTNKAVKKAPANKAVKKNPDMDISHLEGGRYFRGALRAAILKRDNYQCVMCGAKAGDGNILEVDHIVEYEDGGKTTFENGQTICQSCNKGKSELKRHSTEFVTPNQFSKILGVHRNKVNDAIQKGILSVDEKTKKINKKEGKVQWNNYYSVDRTLKKIKDDAVSFIIPEDVLQKHAYSFGRPSQYTPDMCNELVQHMAVGRSFSNAATLMGLSHVIVYDWIKEFDVDGNPNPRFKPDFFKAYKIGQELSELWWDETGRINLNNKEFNNTLYMMFRQNKHGWTRRLEGKMELEKTERTINENRTVHEHIIRIQGEDELAEIARILEESGALESAISTVAESETH